MALIVTLGALTVLTLLATTFTLLSGIERNTAGNFVLEVRAMMLAHSGMEYAIAVLRSPGAAGAALAYGGEDWNGLREATGSADGDLDDRHGNRNGVVDVMTCPARYARRPSLFVDADGDGMPDLVPVLEEGQLRMRGFSGRLAGTFHPLGDTFILKVEDAGGRVSINQTGAGYRQLYENLGQLALGIGGLGAAIQGSQPYTTVDELVAKGALSTAQLDILRPHLTTWSWVDPTTIRPDAQTDTFNRPENLRRTGWLEPRAPINVNRADFLVIKACLLGISGFNTERIVPRKRSFVLSSNMADRLARAIIVAREETFTDLNGNHLQDPGEPYVDLNGNGRFDGPFRTWEQFTVFLESIPGFIGHGRGRGANNFSWPRDLVLANADPNSRLNCFQPDHHLRRSIDKADLLVYTTEFCFDSNGVFTVRSLGRVTDSEFVAVAEREIEAVFRTHEVVKLSTQEDFESARVKVSAGPDVMTIPEEMGQIATESFVDANDDGRFNGTESFADANGDGMRDGPAIYDGQITLRPADPSETQPWGDGSANLAFRCLFNDSYGVGGLGPAVYPSYNADRSSPTATQGVPLAGPVLRTTVDRGGSLLRDVDGANDYPDLGPTGMFVHESTGEVIYWNSVLNWPVGSGSIDFWIRPVWESRPQGNQYKDILSLNQNFSLDPNRGRITLLSSVHFGQTPGIFNLLSDWYSRTRRTDATEVADDTGFNPAPWASTHYRINLRGSWDSDHWHHFALRYVDQIRYRAWMDAEPFDTIVEQRLPGGGHATLGNPSPTYNLMTLGSQLPWKGDIGTGTYDDFRIFRSQVPSSEIGLTPAWRYVDTGVAGWGHYTGEIRLPANARVRTIAWTEVRPFENYRGEPLSSTAPLPRQRRPDVHASYRVSTESAWRAAPRPIDPDAFDGGAVPTDRSLPPVGGGRFQFRFDFDRNGQDPFREAPVIDDVVITYSTGGGVVFLTWRVVGEE